MSDPSQEPQASSDEETYRIAAPEAAPAATDSAAPLSDGDFADAAVRPKRRKKRRAQPARETPQAAADSSEAPDAPWQNDARTLEWTADTGWREPALISSVWYPLTGNGWRLVPVYALFLWLGQLIPFVGLLLSLFAMCYTAVLLLETANFTLEEVPGGPQTPDWFSWDTISVGLMGLVAFLISGIPLLFGLAIMVKLGSVNPYAQLVLTAVSLFYLPMAFLVLADRQSESALNPLLVFDGIKQMWSEYIVACGIAAAVFTAPTCLLVALDVHPFAWQIVMGFLLIYSGTALMRAVALMAKKRGLSFSVLEEESDDDAEEPPE